MPPAIRLRIIEGDADPQAEAREPAVSIEGRPLRAANEEPDAAPEVSLAPYETRTTGVVEASDRRVYFRLVIFSLLIHAAVVAATMRDNPFGEERSAGGTEERVTLEGISVELFDSVPNSGASLPETLAEATPTDAADTPRPVEDVTATAAPAAETIRPETGDVALLQPDEIEAEVADDPVRRTLDSRAAIAEARPAEDLSVETAAVAAGAPVSIVDLAAAPVAEASVAPAPVDAETVQPSTEAVDVAHVAQEAAPVVAADEAPVASVTAITPTAVAAEPEPVAATPPVEAETATLAELPPEQPVPAEDASAASPSAVPFEAAAAAMAPAPAPVAPPEARDTAPLPVPAAAPSPRMDDAPPAEPAAPATLAGAVPPIPVEAAAAAPVAATAPITPTDAATPSPLADLSDPLVAMDAPLPKPRPVRTAREPEAKTVKPPAKRPAGKRPRPEPAASAAPPIASPFFSLGGPASAASIEQPTGRGSAAGSAGTGGTSSDARGRASISSYQAKATAHLRRFRVYPQEARRQGIRGTAMVAFTVNARGAVLGVTLTRSSGSSILDAAALGMVRRASPFPPLPPELGSSTTVRAPIQFSFGR